LRIADLRIADFGLRISECGMGDFGLRLVFGLPRGDNWGAKDGNTHCPIPLSETRNVK
jgi:hypothetical protein